MNIFEGELYVQNGHLIIIQTLRSFVGSFLYYVAGKKAPKFRYKFTPEVSSLIIVFRHRCDQVCVTQTHTHTFTHMCIYM